MILCGKCKEPRPVFRVGASRTCVQWIAAGGSRKDRVALLAGSGQSTSARPDQRFALCKLSRRRSSTGLAHHPASGVRKETSDACTGDGSTKNLSLEPLACAAPDGNPDARCSVGASHR